LFTCDDLERLAAVLGFPEHPDPPALAQAAGHPVAEEGMIVDHDHGYQSCHRRCPILFRIRKTATFVVTSGPA
jgi:hypothetical protein